MRFVVFKHHEVAAPVFAATKREAMDRAVDLHRRNGGRYFIARIDSFTDVVVKSNAR